eukprot:608058-Prorocentrum_minimum.AAC.1
MPNLKRPPRRVRPPPANEQGGGRRGTPSRVLVSGRGAGGAMFRAMIPICSIGSSAASIVASRAPCEHTRPPAAERVTLPLRPRMTNQRAHARTRKARRIHAHAATEGEIVAAEGEIAVTEGDIAATEGEIAVAEGEIAATEGEIAVAE